MDASNGMVTVEVRLGRPVYRGRAVAGGELVYQPEDNAWLQVVKDKGRFANGARSSLATLVRTPSFAVLATLIVSLVAVAFAVLRKPTAAPEIGVEAFKQTAVEVVNEPFHGVTQPAAVLDAPAPASAPPPVPSYRSTAPAGPLATPKIERPTSQTAPVPVRSQTQDHPVQAASEPSRGASTPTQDAFVLLNRSDAPAPKAVPAAKPLRLVAVADENTIVLSNPQNGVPVPFKIGARLFDGSVLKSVDLRSGSATTDKGVLKLE